MFTSIQLCSESVRNNNVIWTRKRTISKLADQVPNNYRPNGTRRWEEYVPRNVYIRINEKRIPDRCRILFVRKNYKVENERRGATRRKVGFPRAEASLEYSSFVLPPHGSPSVTKACKTTLGGGCSIPVTTRKLGLPLTSTTRYERGKNTDWRSTTHTNRGWKRDGDLRSQRGHVHLLVNLGYGIELRFPRKRFGVNERAAESETPRDNWELIAVEQKPGEGDGFSRVILFWHILYEKRFSC